MLLGGSGVGDGGGSELGLARSQIDILVYEINSSFEKGTMPIGVLNVS